MKKTYKLKESFYSPKLKKGFTQGIYITSNEYEQIVLDKFTKPIQTKKDLKPNDEIKPEIIQFTEDQLTELKYWDLVKLLKAREIQFERGSNTKDLIKIILEYQETNDWTPEVEDNEALNALK
jgi:hypothetical protein